MDSSEAFGDLFAERENIAKADPAVTLMCRRYEPTPQIDVSDGTYGLSGLFTLPQSAKKVPLIKSERSDGRFKKGKKKLETVLKYMKTIFHITFIPALFYLAYRRSKLDGKSINWINALPFLRFK
ncbi:uncharacterized protein LOC119661840 [Teleopsis dalmanni]|uniref:uncharacterized protein LOC119661840 n=1 Tax=Teleopsis dalmanni TaxID=139649 RepID=UPI0018CFDEDF|nr:uncharacterized protein LOC119661840 [Teleopsis dalmanni]